MQNDELKFLLRLLGCTNYRSSLTAKGFKDFKGKDKICRDLGDRELVDYSREIASVKILPPGRALLKMEAAQLPITEKEQKILEKIAQTSGKIAPNKIVVKSVTSADRDTILQNFYNRGLIEVETKIKRQRAEVWLTQRGVEFLRDEFIAKGTHPIISLDLLTNYLRFLRKSLRVAAPENITSESTATATNKPSDEKILQNIRDLDREMGTENYLPIFHLRQKFQPPLSREELDQVLYRLQGDDKIELSSLVDPTPYTAEQVEAGIPKDFGGRLFFIVVN